jgi:tRNA (Thr-GGU) A37 N-methylase
VTGSDLLNGTPILDIKPYIQYSDAIKMRKVAMRR